MATSPTTPAPESSPNPPPVESTPEEHDVQHNQDPIEADDPAAFSDYSDSSSLASSTQSITSSIMEHVYTNGRRYHRKSSDENQQYLMPSDETEMDRLDMMHHMGLLTLDGELYSAPITESPHNVLDCGTGTGIWALEFGNMHTESNVIGVDLAPNQPAWTYPNVSFETDDLEKEWTYKKNHFNYIHSRTLGTAIKDWAKYTKQMFEHAAPGAFVEIAEHSVAAYCDDNTVPADSIYITYCTILSDALLKVGVDVRPYSARFFRQQLEAAGFVDIKVMSYKIPWGPWPKSKKFKYMGAVCAEIFRTGLEAYGLMAMTRLQNIPEEEAKSICTEFYKTMLAGKQHGYHLQWYIVARKPETTEA
ncbi:S-adenosyl-L-methionine-dependent methyltransferase [Ascodesmis nigricans]|uniref:S-adenosyl-L-methionine-dependent methyltransferase n=1 Tax=Ascodesmis nigricans TaxID=341454 RepID=A0A4S2MJ67_9PEZI|nr:S-adenosyl-L-methionine-dependent methyltransferase [Ascodesmis nigricans]